jgi:hypothetical protein
MMLESTRAGHFLSSMPSACRQLLDQPRLIVGVEDGEVALQSDQFGMAAQHPHADRMEGAEPHAIGRAADQLRHAVEHLARRLVGEGDGQDLRRPCTARDQLMGDAGGEHARLAGARAGQHEQRPTLVDNCPPLLLVKSLEMAEDTTVRIPAGSGAGTGSSVISNGSAGGAMHII